MFRHTFLIFLLVGLFACASFSVENSLKRVHVGMDKDEVLDVAGNPKHSYHSKGADHWIYLYYHGDKPFIRHLIFENGRLAHILPPHEKLGKDDLSDTDDDFNKLEDELRSQQKPKVGQFVDVPGQSGE